MAGLSLIELMVSMVIGLVVTLAITAVLVHGEASKRSTSSVNDVNQTGAYLAYVLDRHMRGAGSGYAQRWADAFGCVINATKDGATVLPRTSAIAGAFANAPLSFPLAPVIIQADGATPAAGQPRGDLITVMAGTAGFSGAPHLVQTSSVHSNGSNGDLQLPNTLGYQNGDVLLLADSGVPQGCMTQEVAGLPSGGGGTSALLPLAGRYYSATGSSVDLGAFGGNTYAMPLGRMPENPPQFLIYGVGDNRTLFSYDLLRVNAPDAPVPVADGVVEMRAIYGLDTTNPPDGTLDSWVLPEAASGFDAATLADGSAASRQRLRQIVAVRVGFILRTSLKEKKPVLGGNYESGTDSYTVDLFTDLEAAGQNVARRRTITGDERYYRFRAVEVTVPLRNVMLAPAS